jgi:hypothetical protein
MKGSTMLEDPKARQQPRVANVLEIGLTDRSYLKNSWLEIVLCNHIVGRAHRRHKISVVGERSFRNEVAQKLYSANSCLAKRS